MRMALAILIGGLLVGCGIFAGFLLALTVLQSNISTSAVPEHLAITNFELGNGSMAVTANNTGIAAATIVNILVNDTKQSPVTPSLPLTLAPDAGVIFNINTNLNFSLGGSYLIELLTSKGNMFSQIVQVPVTITYTTGQAGVLLYESNVRFYSNGTQIDVGIGNSGTLDTTITALYIGTSSSSMENQTITSEPLAAGSVQTITVNYSWQPGATYYFKVVVATGQALGPWPEQAPTS
jgi:hypothetical protein